MGSYKNKYEANLRDHYSCIDLRILRSDGFRRQLWLRILMSGLKNGYRRFQQNRRLLYSSSNDRRMNYFIWAAGLIVFTISLVQSLLK